MLIALPVDQIAYYLFVFLSCFPGVGLLAFAFASLRRELAPGGPGELKVSQAIAETGFERIDDFFIKSANGKLTQIDHAVKMPGGILVIETKDWRGHFEYPIGREGPWLEVTEAGKSPAFGGKNPFEQNKIHCSAVREATGGMVPVWSAIVMANDECGFNEEACGPDDVPEVLRRIIMAGGSPHMPHENWPVVWWPQDLKVNFATLKRREHADADKAWKKLKKAALTDRRTRLRHADQVGGSNTKGRAGTFLTLTAAAAAAGAASAAFWAFQWGYIG